MHMALMIMELKDSARRSYTVLASSSWSAGDPVPWMLDSLDCDVSSREAENRQQAQQRAQAEM
jgi:hypothetical protein